jgi:hypothetical protein
VNALMDTSLTWINRLAFCVMRAVQSVKILLTSVRCALLATGRLMIADVLRLVQLV